MSLLHILVRCLQVVVVLIPVTVLTCIIAMAPTPVYTQNNNDDDNDNNNDEDEDEDDNNDNNNDNNDDDNFNDPFGGIQIDANGVFIHDLRASLNGQIDLARVRAAHAQLGDLAKPSKLRKVSLPRLERALAKRVEAGRLPTDDMLRLAGLTRVQYVFCYPETGDIVLAGPAEGWVRDTCGVHRGLVSGRPTLNLEDLIVALRAFGPTDRGPDVISCSIDATEAGLVNMQAFMRKVGRHATPAQTTAIAEGLRDSLGLQQVTIQGVSPRTHFAKVMVEADYRMKLIGIGLERPPVHMSIYLERVTPSEVSRNAMQRWWFTPEYKAIRETNDQLAVKFEGKSVRLVGELELVDQTGRRKGTNKESRASKMFTQDFTAKYAEIANQATIYGELRNVIDLAISAAYIQKRGWYEKADWSMQTFGNERLFAVERHRELLKVPTVANAIWRGRTLMTPVGGGVHIKPTASLTSENLLSDIDGSVDSIRSSANISTLRDEQWWWD